MPETAVITVYGIPNCDTIRKARRWLTDNNIDHHFHDYRKAGIDAELLRSWIETLGEWQNLVNRRGTTWRKVDDETRNGLDANRAIALMIEQPALIKRPVLVTGKQVLVGFDEARYREVLSR